MPTILPSQLKELKTPNRTQNRNSTVDRLLSLKIGSTFEVKKTLKFNRLCHVNLTILTVIGSLGHSVVYHKVFHYPQNHNQPQNQINISKFE